MKTNKYSPAPISNVNDLNKEIAILKARVKAREEDLGERIKQAPSRALKASTSAIIPSFLQKAAPSGLGNILGLAFSLWRNKKKGTTIKNALVSNAGQVGLMAAAKGIFSFISKRKKAKEEKELRKFK